MYVNQINICICIWCISVKSVLLLQVDSRYCVSLSSVHFHCCKTLCWVLTPQFTHPVCSWWTLDYFWSQLLQTVLQEAFSQLSFWYTWVFQLLVQIPGDGTAVGQSMFNFFFFFYNIKVFFKEMPPFHTCTCFFIPLRTPGGYTVVSH